MLVWWSNTDTVTATTTLRTALFSAHVEEASGAKPSAKHLVISYRAPKAQLLAPSETAVPRPVTLEFAVTLFDENGQLLNSFTQEGTTDVSWIKSGQQASNTYSVQQSITAMEKASSMRVVVADASSGKSGSLDVPLPLAESKE